MFATLPPKESRQTDRPNYQKPLPPGAQPQKKREHRVARVYEPNLKPDFPNRPQTARLPAERPAPILALPGLPPRPFTPSVKDQRRLYGTPKWFDGAGDWLAKIRTPWARDPAAPKSAPIRPATPATGRTPPRTPHTPRTPRFLWQSETRSPRVKDNRTLADFDDTIRKDEEFAFSPSLPVDDMYKPDDFPSDHEAADFELPPLYQKHAMDGGVNAWRTAFGAFLIQFCTMGYLFTWNVFEDVYAHTWFTDESPIVIRLIICLQLFLAFGLSVVSGKLADLGWLRIPLAGGSALFAVSLFILSAVPQEGYGMALVFHGIVMGIALGFTFLPSIVISMLYFQRRRGLVTGLVLAGGSLGSVIFPGLLRKIILAHGFGKGIRTTAFIITPLLLIGNLAIVKPPREPEPDFPLPRLDLAKYKKQKQYVLAGAATIAGLVAILFPSFYLQLLALDLRINPDSAFNTIVVFSVTAVLGRILAGFASDLYGIWNGFFVTSGLNAVMTIAMIGVRGQKGLIAYSIFFGFFSGAWFSIAITTLASMASRTDEIGTRIGLVFTLASPMLLIAPILYNVLLTRSQKWAIPSMLFTVLFVGATGATFLTRVFMLRRTKDVRRKLWLRWKMIPAVAAI